MSAMLITNNSAAASVAENGILPLGAAIHGCGSSIRLNGNGINLLGKGYYKVTASITAAPTGTGAFTVQLYSNGTAIPGAIASETPTAANASVDLTIVWIIKRCCETTALTLVANSAASVTNTTVVVEQ